MIERGTVGGTCVNTGCAPSRALLAAASDRTVGYALGLGLGAVPGVELGGGGAGSSHRLAIQVGWLAVCHVSQWIARITRITKAPAARQALRCSRGLRGSASSRSWPRLMGVCSWLVVMCVASLGWDWA